MNSVVTEKVIDRFEEDGYRKIKEDRYIYLSKSPPWKLLDPLALESRIAVHDSQQVVEQHVNFNLPT